MSKPMMKCGHAAQAIDGKGDPACVICHPDPEARIVANPAPSLEGRRARCAYYGSVPTGRNHSSNHRCKRSDPCLCEEDSSATLAFFEHKPGKDFDGFYCGCWGWA